MTRKKIPVHVKGKLLIEQDYRCNICTNKLQETPDGIPLYDIDHIEMHSISKNDSIENLQAICLTCHRIKTVRELQERRRKTRVLDIIPEERIILTNKPNPFEMFKFDTEDFTKK